MQDMKLIELVNAARAEAHHDIQALRQEFRNDLAAVRSDVTRLMPRMMRYLVILGLALGGKDLLVAFFNS